VACLLVHPISDGAVVVSDQFNILSRLKPWYYYDEY
jgi:hypothetical protein